jgi:hypothetical protein
MAGPGGGRLAAGGGGLEALGVADEPPLQPTQRVSRKQQTNLIAEELTE